MSDPAVEAVRRALEAHDPARPSNLSRAAAREALKPVREVVERYEILLNPWDDVGFEILNALRPLVYPSEELKR